MIPEEDLRLYREKTEQATSILEELQIDLWFIFSRETNLDPTLQLVFGGEVTWQSAFLIARNGRRIAIVGNYDQRKVQDLGLYDPVLGYKESMKDDLVRVLTEIDARKIAINFSPHDPIADGLTHGMYLELARLLKGTPAADRLISAETLVSLLKARKTPSEVERIEEAVRHTEDLFHSLTRHIRPGVTEIDLAARMQQLVRERDLGYAWEKDECPMVISGPDSPFGHRGPGAVKIRRGHLVHCDFGISSRGFCSDLQRTWYVLDEGENMPPRQVGLAFAACRRAIDEAFAHLKPGVRGHEVDLVARKALVEAGYPEYDHALGHQVGRLVHDGSAVLAPPWDRYGDKSSERVEAGSVFTLELEIKVDGRGYVGLEDMVQVTPGGARWLSRPQQKVIAV